MRSRSITLVTLTLALTLGFAAGGWAAKKKSIDSSLYTGKAPAEAARFGAAAVRAHDRDRSAVADLPGQS